MFYSIKEVLASTRYDYIRELAEVEEAEKQAEEDLQKERQKWQERN